jgi:hypothetical protein
MSRVTCICIPSNRTNSQLYQCKSSILSLITMGKENFVGYDVLVTFLDGLFSALWFGDLRFKVFEACELAVYCDECCFSDILTILKGNLRDCRFNLRKHGFELIAPCWFHSKLDYASPRRVTVAKWAFLKNDCRTTRTCVALMEMSVHP